MNKEALKEYDAFDSVKLINQRSNYRTLLYTLYAILFIFFLILFVPWRQNIRAYGSVTALRPQDRPQTVNATIGGMIKKWHIAEGQYVNAGDTIVSITEIKDKYFDPSMVQRLQEQLTAKQEMMQSMDDKVGSLRKQIDALKNGMKYSSVKAANKVKQNRFKVISDSTDYEANKIAYDIALKQFDRFKELYNKGIKSLTDLENRKMKFQESSAKLVASENKLSAARQELINSEVELNSITAEYTDKIAKSESELNAAIAYIHETEGAIAKMKNELASTQIRSGFYYIRSPQNGYVVKALKEGVGEILKEGESVVTVMPDKPSMAVELYMKPMDIPLIRKNDEVRLQFDGWPALQFSGWPNVAVGTFGGKVQVIDYVNSKDGNYRVLIVPDTTIRQWPQQLRVGSGVMGWTLLGHVPVWYELWRQINGFPAGLKKKPENFDKNKSQESYHDE